MSSQAYVIVDGIEVEVIRHRQISGRGPIDASGRQAFFAIGAKCGRLCPTIGKPFGSIKGTKLIDVESFPNAKSVVVKVWYVGGKTEFVRVK